MLDTANGFGASVSPGDGQTTVKIAFSASLDRVNMLLSWGVVEPMTGIEPAYSAWEADVLPLNYIGAGAQEG